MNSDSFESTPAARARRRIAARVVPLVFSMYVVNYLDRANLSFAKIPMTKELHFTEDVYGLGVAIFFIGYLALEIPGALIVEHFGARRWMARILITWGLCTVAIGMVRTPGQFYTARFFLGLAEAGFFPGIIVYLTHWFSLPDRARAMSSLVVAIPVAMGVGAIVSTGILQIHMFNLSGWRWLFILEGLPAVALGIFVLFYLTDRPASAPWLEPDERDWITGTLEAERQAKHEMAHITVFQALRQRNVILLALALFAANLNSYTFVFWLPSVIEGASGLPIWAVTLLSALPYAAGFVATLVVSYLSDRSGRRIFYTIMPLVATAVALMLSAVPGTPFWLVMLWLCFAGAGIYAGSPSFWVLPTLTLQASAAAASIGLINAIANFSGFVAPLIVGNVLARGFKNEQIVPFVACCPLVGAVLIALLRFPPQSQNDATQLAAEMPPEL